MGRAYLVSGDLVSERAIFVPPFKAELYIRDFAKIDTCSVSSKSEYPKSGHGDFH